ncbi:MAG: pyridoxal phosphate-dependent aminotransferase [Planctomycetota bacterium]|nr:pyridoxal phosphate-dependent aminotransferase [Planctomycetota bacterium]
MNIENSANWFTSDGVNRPLLRQRAFNFRWAEVAPDVLPLTSADPDFPVAPQIIEAVTAYVSDGLLGYGPTTGLVEFREEVASMLHRRGIPSHPDQVLATDGAASALRVACRAVLGPGDEAITFDPVDFLLPHCAEEAGAKVLRCRLQPGSGEIPDGALEPLIGPRTRAILICNPHNPTGRVLRREELERVASLAIKHDLVIISDEVWSDIILGDVPMISIGSLGEEVARRTITVSGFSKTYGLAGLRIGFIHCGCPKLASRVLEVSGAPRTTFGASVLSQVAAQAAIRDGQQWREGFLHHLRKMRQIGAARLDALDGFHCTEPEGTYLFFPDIRETGMAASELARELETRARVAVVPGEERWFGAGSLGHIRLSFATSEEILDEALARIEQWSKAR